MKKILIFICAFISIQEINAQIITTIAGNGVEGFFGDNGAATLAKLNYPTGITFDFSGNLYIADELNTKIRKVDTNGIITTIAGIEMGGYAGDNGPATAAKFCDLGYIKMGTDSCLYIPDICNNRIRKIDKYGIITTDISNGFIGCNNDTGLSTSITMKYPFGIAFDYMGNLYFGDGCNRIYKKDITGIITRFAGSDSLGGCSGDGGPATDAKLHGPIDIAIDLYGNMYISDLVNNVIRKVDTFGIITKYAGTDTTFGYTGDNGPATLAKFNYPEGLAIDGAGNVFVSDEDNDVVRRIDHETNIITTVAGNGTPGYSGDSFAATNAQLLYPAGLAFDATGNLYIADWQNNRIRKVTNVGVPLKVNKAKEVNNLQEYSLSPNPNNGDFYISQLMPDNNPVTVNIWNSIGIKIQRENIIFNTSNQSINLLNKIPGIYLVNLTDSKGRSFTFQFILK